MIASGYRFSFFLLLLENTKVSLWHEKLSVLNRVGHVGQTRGLFSWVKLAGHFRGSFSRVKLVGHSRGSNSWVIHLDRVYWKFEAP